MSDSRWLMVTPCILNDDDVSWWKSPELPRPHGWVSSFLWKILMITVYSTWCLQLWNLPIVAKCGGHPLFGYPAESAWSQIIFIGDALLSVRPPDPIECLRYLEIFWDSTDILRCSSSCCSSCSTVQDFRSWGVRPSQAPLRLLESPSWAVVGAGSILPSWRAPCSACVGTF